MGLRQLPPTELVTCNMKGLRDVQENPFYLRFRFIDRGNGFVNQLGHSRKSRVQGFRGTERV